MTRLSTQVLIIGAGLAGSIAALRLADRGIRVSLLAAGEEAENANSWLAQGGIIYRSEDSDDAQLLAEDILTAGCRHNDAQAVRFLAGEGPRAVREMLVERVRARFDRHDAGSRLEEEWDLTREGGHSRQRIIHSADHTGRTIMEAVREAVRQSPCIRMLQGYTAIDLLTSHHHTKGMTYRYQLENRCCGAYVYCESSRRVVTMLADVTILATGGVGQIYLHSTNAAGAVGSGIAMASRAFVRLENMEFMQFHPTSLYHLEPRRVLVTEALRGEGAWLVDSRGRRFMTAHDQRGELAPRDVVARAIVEELLASGEPCVYLDTTPVRQNLEKRFPTVLKSCRERGIDIRSQLIPVVPAAHYFCGGILADLTGRTTLERLYSIGECSCTGVHGANRLASTSLLEALLWGVSAGDDIAARLEGGLEPLSRVHEAIEDWKSLGDERNDDPALLAQDWTAIRNIMWNYVGISRTEFRLARAFNELRALSRTLHDFYRSTPLSKPIIDLFHGCQTACLITQAALRNTGDLGCHHRV
ncbi:MAG: L-aspartate oxidase [Desulfovibrio sp.]|jgi:L-aspartate oxidase|nr:L-aspartate oxidase [Desulfovibrio sp.]